MEPFLYAVSTAGTVFMTARVQYNFKDSAKKTFTEVQPLAPKTDPLCTLYLCYNKSYIHTCKCVCLTRIVSARCARRFQKKLFQLSKERGGAVPPLWVLGARSTAENCPSETPTSQNITYNSESEYT